MSFSKEGRVRWSSYGWTHGDRHLAPVIIERTRRKRKSHKRTEHVFLFPFIRPLSSLYEKNTKYSTRSEKGNSGFCLVPDHHPPRTQKKRQALGTRMAPPFTHKLHQKYCYWKRIFHWNEIFKKALKLEKPILFIVHTLQNKRENTFRLIN